MRLFRIVWLIAIAIGVCSIAGCSSLQGKRFQTLIPDLRKDELLFKEVNRATELAEQTQLRQVRLQEGDMEVRVWRGFSTEPLEGVLLKRTDGQWSGIYLKTDTYYDAQGVISKPLPPPHSEWEPFWRELTNLGLTSIQQNTANECDISGIDDIGYVVEINADQTYRYYFYPESHPKCEEAKKTVEIGETIGLEFDSGFDQCTRTEWFPCMTYRKQHK